MCICSMGELRSAHEVVSECLVWNPRCNCVATADTLLLALITESSRNGKVTRLLAVGDGVFPDKPGPSEYVHACDAMG